MQKLFSLSVFILALIMPFQSAFAAFQQEVQIDIEVDDVAPAPSIYFRLQQCKEIIQKAYDAMPEYHRSGLKRLKILWSAKMGRGLGGGDEIHLRCNNVSDKELIGVFVHEMGHIADTGVYRGNAASGESQFQDSRIQLFEDDESIDFYKISWLNVKQKQRDSSNLDFVTGYAMTDPFEDFAESYTFYILHGRQFKQMMQQSTRLKRKYEFLKENIFDGKEFVNKYRKPNLKTRDYDSTVLPFSLENFLKRR